MEGISLILHRIDTYTSNNQHKLPFDLYLLLFAWFVITISGSQRNCKLEISCAFVLEIRGRVKNGGEGSMVASLWGNFPFSSTFQRHVCLVFSPHIHSCSR